MGGEPPRAQRKGGYRLTIMKAQLTLIGIVMVFVALIVFLALSPALDTVITDNSGSFSGGALILVQLIPFFFIVGIILALFFYISPSTPSPYRY